MATGYNPHDKPARPNIIEMKQIYMRSSFTFIFLTLILFRQGFAQEPIQKINRLQVKGILVDAKTKNPLPYANIVVERIDLGGITNEEGKFSINPTDLKKTDFLTFHYIGYKTKRIVVDSIFKNPTVLLEEDIEILSNVFVFDSPPNAKDIVKKVLENKDKNYTSNYKQEEVFIRTRNIAEIKNFNLGYIKSSISELDEQLMQEIQDKTPRYTTYYSDVLSSIYHSGYKDDSVKLKVKPVKVVELKEKDLTDLDHVAEVFDEVFSNTSNKEYWKFRIGIISTKIDDQRDIDNSINTDEIKSMGSTAKRYSSLNDGEEWEFLHSTGKYNYHLVGVTSEGNENVYVIDFTPKRGGLYTGRVYVSVSTYALIRADYQYDSGKLGMDIHLFGIGYTENNFIGSILFEKTGSIYEMKYCSRKMVTTLEVDRNISLIKKRDRLLIDKTLKGIKIDLSINYLQEDSFEYLVLSKSKLEDDHYNTVKPPKYTPVTYVDQFDASLWEDYTTIAPTEQMREYKKQN